MYECLVCECIYTCTNTLRVHLGMASFSFIQILTKFNYICTCNERLLQLMAIVFTYSLHTIQADLFWHILFDSTTPSPPYSLQTLDVCVAIKSILYSLLDVLESSRDTVCGVHLTPCPIRSTLPAGKTCWESTG